MVFAFVVGAVVWAQESHADLQGDYIAELSKYVEVYNPDGMMKLGVATCAALSVGYSTDEIAAEIQRQGFLTDAPLDAINNVVEVSNGMLCPQLPVKEQGRLLTA